MFVFSLLGKYLYTAGEDGFVYVFDVVSSQLENAINVLQPPGYSGGNAATATGKEIIGIIHHPQRNIVAVISDTGHLTLWKP